MPIPASHFAQIIGPDGSVTKAGISNYANTSTYFEGTQFQRVGGIVPSMAPLAGATLGSVQSETIFAPVGGNVPPGGFNIVSLGG